MNKEVCFKCIKTPKGYYVFDRYSGSIISLTKDEFVELERIEQNVIESDNSVVIKKFEKQNLLLPHVIEEIKHPDSDFVEHLVDKRLSQLILQVTQQCNLRCSYCIYGGMYENRSHSNETMTLDLAQKSIDFFLKHSYETDHLVISFYGGEPLLNIELIKQCVEYAVKNIDGKKVLFTITTNGTLLTEEIMDFLAKNSFYTLVSLDGAKEEHDLNRKFRSGQGSFDIIVNNINKFKSKFPEYVNKYLQINAVISPKTRTTCVEDFFSANDFLEDKQINFTPLNLTGLKEDVNIEYDYVVKREYEYFKLLLYLLGKIKRESVSKLVIELQGDIKKLYRMLKRHKKVALINHHSGPCVPGCSRLFVNVKGDFYPCERVPELACCCIGNIDHGFDTKKIREILNIGKLTENECKKCWAISMCNMCINELNCSQDCFLKEEKLKSCLSNKAGVMRDLYELLAICELGYEIDVEDE